MSRPDTLPPRRPPVPSGWACLEILFLAVLMIPVAGCSTDRGAAEIDFNHDIHPILSAKCLHCHGGVRRQAGLSLAFRSDALQAGRSGKAAIVPGDAPASEVMRRVTHSDPAKKMPREGTALTPDEIATLRRWIDAGAEWTDHWAYVAPVSPTPPAVSDSSWPSGGLDAFILARLESEGLSPSDPAPCPLLVRRLSLDLIGLPPSLLQVVSVCDNPSPQAYEELVDELLASSRFGERWAAMWLDLARYADTQGYEKDNPRTIWRYRDWVIRAFNADMPFDRFTIQQLAGDLLPEPSEESRIATAFHRNTMTNSEGGTDDEEYRMAAVMDRVNTTWEVWQGTSFACVQCHGHPFDPFRHEEYYGVLAFFNNTADWDQTHERPTLASFPDGKKAAGAALLDRIETVERQILERASTPEMVQARRLWEGRLQDPAALADVSTTWQGEVLRIARIPESERDPAQRSHIRYIFSQIHPTLEGLRQKRKSLRDRLDRLNPVMTPVMQELSPEQRRKTYVFDRGSFLTRLQEVQPDVPASMPAFPSGEPRNRLGLARWLVSEENPLTSRVIVNRFWEQIFGRGLVETLEDFGSQGRPPSHPALLDWLAVRFRETHGWSVKALLKDLVLSSTYRQASGVTPQLLQEDPGNILLARGPRRRLSAEQLRDQALAVSGLLSETMYGPSSYPYQPPGLWMNPYSEIDWVTSRDSDRHRRGLYTYWRRTAPYPAMTTFGTPSRELCVSRRAATNTPLQALVTLNDPAYTEAAQALARRILERTASGGGSDPIESPLREGYRLALGRAPTDEKLAVLKALYQDSLQHYRDRPAQAGEMVGEVGPGGAEQAALTVVSNVILNLDEFVTKE